MLGNVATFRADNRILGIEEKTMTLAVDEFIRRFLVHVLPEGFQRIHYYGFLANRYCEQKLARCRQLLAMPQPGPSDDHPEDYRDQYHGLTGASLTSAPSVRAGAWSLSKCSSPPSHAARSMTLHDDR
jgi:hypothetical protein